MSTNYEAVPCSVCGREPLIGHEDDSYFLQCMHCGEDAAVGGGYTEDKAILDWNDAHAPDDENEQP